MSSAETRVEHFVTLFDRNFLAAGLCLYRSLTAHAGAFRLWIICMDEVTRARLEELALPEVRLLPLAEVETEELRRVKGGRTMGEYCWTLTPYAPRFVMERDPSARRVTYLDADLYFFGDPRGLLRELEDSGAQVLITPHAYAPEYDQTSYSGIYCVQFVAFNNSEAAREVLRWWQERCIEWCYNRSEDGKFGDQKYLDDWPQRFAGVVHPLRRAELALGPWNASRFLRDDAFLPVFFHFHGLRVVSERRLLLYMTYRLGGPVQRLYDRYLEEYSRALGTAYARWGDIPGLGRPLGARERVLRIWNRLRGTIRYAPFRVSPSGGVRDPRAGTS